MTTPLLFKEYIWLVNTIHDAGHRPQGNQREMDGHGDERGRGAVAQHVSPP